MVQSLIRSCGMLLGKCGSRGASAKVLCEVTGYVILGYLLSNGLNQLRQITLIREIPAYAGYAHCYTLLYELA